MKISLVFHVDRCFHFGFLKFCLFPVCFFWCSSAFASVEYQYVTINQQVLKKNYSTFPMKHFYQRTWFIRKNIDFLIGRTILIRTNNAAKSFYALSHIYALRIEMVDVIFVQTKHKYFLSANFGLYRSLFNTACMGCLRLETLLFLCPYVPALAANLIIRKQWVASFDFGWSID